MIRVALARLEPRQLGLILGGIALLGAAMAVSYLVVPKLKAYRTVSQTHEVLSGVTASGEGLAEELKTRQADVESLRRTLHGDLANLPARQMEAYIVGRLQTISWRNDVELVGVQPDEGGRVEAFREMLFGVELSGRYFDLYHWLRDAATELGFVVVKEYAMTPGNQDLDDPLLTVTMTMASYRSEAAQ